VSVIRHPGALRHRGLILTVLLLAITTVVATSCARTATVAGPAAPADAALAPVTATTDRDVVPLAQLPREAQDTLALINSGGPYPYRQDGTTFQNREEMLPSQRPGFYREFTVTTPGSPDRGARRVVAADDGARFYTSDHYQSFQEIVR
jgi:ribonuclease T1